MSEPVLPTAVPPRATRLHAGPPRWLLPILVMVVGFALVHPFDGPLAARASHLAASMPRDLRRELFAWQQYGQATAIIVAALIVWLLDPTRRRRLLDLVLALLIAQLVSTSAKLLIGRPRPRPEFNDPTTFLSPWGKYPITINGKPTLVHAWDTGANTDLWSMPSSHTLFAAVLSVFLACLYPGLRWLALALALLVGFGRVLFDAHWPTDVIVGAAAGWLIARSIIPTFAGVRTLDWLWTRLVNRRALPAFPTMFAAESARAAKP